MLYVNFIQCSGLSDIYGQLEGVGSVCSGVVVFHRSMVDWRRGGVCLHWYLHCVICDTLLV